MIGNCPAGIAPETLTRDVLASADCLIAGQVQQGYAALLAPGGVFASALTIALTIYVAVFGYRLMLGLTSLTLGELVPHLFKIGIVFALATSWPSYQTLVFDTLFHGPEQLADLIVQQAVAPGTNTDLMAALQEVFTRLTEAAGDAWNQAPPAAVHAAPLIPVGPATAAAAAPAPTPALPSLGAPQLVAALLWVSALVLMAASVGVLLVVRIVLALLLLFGPVFIAFVLFRSTRGLAEGWLKITVKFALVPLFALPLIAAAVAVLEQLVAEFDGAPIASVRDGPVLLILLVVLVFAAVIAQAARLGSGIAGSIRLPQRRVPTAFGSGPEERSATASPIPTASRADVIVQAVDADSRRTSFGPVTRAPATIAGARVIAGPAVGLHSLGDANGRLGQSYRRLAIGLAAPAASRARS